jgi:membrane protease YdiL (CAAX protease family)
MNPPLADSPGRRARDLVALLAAMAFPSIMSWIEFWVLPGDGTETNASLKIVFGLGKVVQFSFPVLYVWLYCREPIRRQRWNRRGLGLGIAFAAVVAAGAFGLYYLLLKDIGVFADTPAKLHHWLTEFHAATPATFVVMALFVSVLHSFLEEYYWRWFVFGRLQRLLPWGVAIAVSSLAFMSHHVLVLAYYLPGQFWIAAAPFSLCVAAGGVFWAWLYHRTGSLFATWISHLLVDSAIMMIGYDMLSPYW